MEISKQEFKEQLIDLVRERQWLFDIGLADYKNKDKKINGWKFIGELLGKSGAECETEWSKIRKQFIGNVRKRKAATGSGRESFPKFRHFESMQFYLDRYRSYPRTISNMDDGTPWSPSSNDIDETDSSVPDNRLPRIVEVETPMPSSDTHSTMSNSQMSFLSSQVSPSSSSSNASRVSNTNYVQSKPPFYRNKPTMAPFETKFLDAYAKKSKMDEHDSFCASLAPKLRRIHEQLPGRTSAVQIKILELIAEEEILIPNDSG